MKIDFKKINYKKIVLILLEILFNAFALYLIFLLFIYFLLPKIYT